MLFAQEVPINPLLPTGSLAVWHLLIVALVALTVALPVYALVSLWRSRFHIETTHLLLWVLVIFAAPIIGSIIWLFFGRDFHGVKKKSVSSSDPEKNKVRF